MGLFKNKNGKGLLGGLVSTVVNGVSGIVAGVVSPLSSAASSIIKSATPMVTEVANSSAGAAFGSALGGGLNPASKLGDVFGKNDKGEKKDLFDYKNDDGSLNTGKVVTHVAIALTGIGVLYLLAKKMRWIK
jgi:hypothetical protein